MTRNFKLFLLLTTVLLLQACALAPVEVKYPGDAAPNPGEGVVVISMTLNTTQLNPYSDIVIEAIATDGSQANKQSRGFKISPVKIINPSTTLYAGNVPAGTYRISSIQSYSYYMTINGNGVLGPFTVEEGKISDLGRVIATAINTKAGLGRSKKYIDNQDLVKNHLPNLYNKMSSLEFIGWDNNHADMDFLELYAQTYPIGMTGFVQLEDYIGAASRMGALFLRSQSGQWRQVATLDDYFPASAVAPYKEGNNILLAGGSQSTLFKITKDRESHTIPTGNLGPGDIEFIQQDPETGDWFIAVRGIGFIPEEPEQVERLAVYRSKDIESGQWEPFIETSLRWDTWSGPTMAWVWRQKNGFGFASTRSNAVHCYDFATQSWTKNEIPEKQRLVGLIPGGNNAVGILTGKGGGFAGIFGRTFFTKDCGAIWTETFSPYKVKAMPPLVLNDGSVLEGGGVFADPGIYSSTTPEIKDSWEKVVEGEILTERLFVTDDGEILMISNGDWGWERIKSSRDGGRSWRTEKSSIDREILRLQNEAENK